MPGTLILLLLLQLQSVPAKRVANFPMRQIDDFRSYRDATLLHFQVPEQILTATWNFTVWERKVYGLSSCEPRPVNVFVKHGSYPVVALDGSTFPDHYYQRNETMYELHFSSNKKPNFLTLTTPLPGDWFAVVFSDYTDPDDDAIQQSGVVLVCVALLESNIDVTVVETMNVIIQKQPVKKRLNATVPVEKFKFFVPENTSLVTVKLTGLENTSLANVNLTGPENTGRKSQISVVNLETSAFISNNIILSKNCTVIGSCEVHFIPTEHRWQYLTVSIAMTAAVVDFVLEIDFEKSKTDECNVTESSQGLTPRNETFPNCWTTVPLMRQTYTGFFTYGFDQVPFDNGTELKGLDLSVKIPTLISFKVNPIQDIGGTLSFELTIDMDSVKNYLKEFQVLLLACVNHELQLMPQFPGKCISSTGIVFPSQLQANSTSESSKTNVKRLHIPFPEYGQWFLSMRPFCFTNDTGDEIVEADCGSLETINVTFIVESVPCDPDSCGPNGRCMTMMDGGLLFSACSCSNGFRGWGCTDDSKVTPQYELLIAALLLTLSNLVFFPAIVIAIRRRFYTEALVYSCTMFFSTFYHACDAGEGVYSFCIFNVGVLQFCDFYTAIMAMWVTIIAMANIPPYLSSLAHMAGAVGIALGTEYNRTSLWMFLAPVTAGLATMITSWVMRCRRTHACYPKKSYWKYYLPPGLMLVAVGLICFAFLQTKRNYKYVHSAWHAIMALSILLVLPRPEKPSLGSVEDDCEAIRSESQSPTESSSWKWKTKCNQWCCRKS